MSSDGKSTPTSTPSAAVVWASTLIVVVMVTASTILVILGKPLTDIVSVFMLAAIPVLAAFGTLISGRLHSVQTQTNGNISRITDALIESNRTLSAYLAVSPALGTSEETPPSS